MPKGVELRPTLDRVRESLFNILGPRLDQARFLDLFAGTGANGIEALSRGAAHATFVDADKRALTAIRRNLSAVRLSSSAVCLKLRLPEGLRALEGPFDIVFADPPYDFDAHEQLIEGLATYRLVAEHGIFVLEHAQRSDSPESAGTLHRTRQSRYGNTALSFYA